MTHAKRTFRTFLALGLSLTATSSLLACDSDGSEDSEASETHSEHGEHGESGEGAESDAESMLEWQAEPPATIAAGTEFPAEFTITTTGEIHVTEVRICEGADVMDCGLGDMDSFDVNFVAENHGAHYHADVTLETAGDYTVVAFAHIGENPHTSHAHNVTVTE